MRPDPHSFFDSEHPVMEHLVWRARVDFDSRTITADATITFNKPGPVALDTHGLLVTRITDGTRSLPFTMGDTDKIMGAPLLFKVPPGRAVKIFYTTSKDAMALQWLVPAQTAGGKHPYLFSQCEEIHARTMVPCQDSPGIRFTFRAYVEVPHRLRAVMAAAFVERTIRGTMATEVWEMDHPIPAYLLALAVGNLESRDISSRSRVWSEPNMVDDAAWEFAGVEQMMLAAEKLFGPYPWGRFDILVMPPSFPYGGMENPTLTFVTPLTVAKDRSMVNVIVHELSHGWTGNLVTNRTWQDFWLNEGWTTWVEMRLMEELYGADIAGVQALRGKQEMERCMRNFAQRGETAYTRLFLPIEGKDPDVAFSQVAYTKGYFLLLSLEEAVGRERFDMFVKKYITTFAFGSIDTTQFLEFLLAELPDACECVSCAEWVYDEGLPETIPVISSATADRVHKLVDALEVPTDEEATVWHAVVWNYYLAAIPRSARDLCVALEERFHLSIKGNARRKWGWFLLAIESGAPHNKAVLRAFLKAIGNMYFLKTLYKELFVRREHREWAIGVFEEASYRYHPITRKVVDDQKKVPLVD